MIYLLRHGETVWNREGRLQGQRDSPLTLTGIAQAQAMARRLRIEIGEPRTWRIVASPLGRAWQSAAIVAEALGMAPAEISHDRRLVEVGFGAWEGLTVPEIEAAAPGAWARRVVDRWGFRPPLGECFADVVERVGPWLESVSDADDLIVVSHGITNRILRGTYAGLPSCDIMTLSESQDEIYRLHDGEFETLETDFGQRMRERA